MKLSLGWPLVQLVKSSSYLMEFDTDNCLNVYIEVINKEIENFLLPTFDKGVLVSTNFSTNTFTYKNIKEFILRGGKRLRPALVLNSYKAIKGKIDEQIIRVSLSVEFLHTASLVHDDLLDQDKMRRGGPTIHVLYEDHAKSLRLPKPYVSLFGTSMGILVGDLIWSLGWRAFFTSKFNNELLIKALDLFNQTHTKIADGQIKELDLAIKENITEAEYFETIYLKTSSLFETSCVIGGILAEGVPSQIDALKSYASALGMAFQIKDDILGTFGDEEETKKPNDSDIKTNKKTLLVIKALEHASENQKTFLKKVLGNPQATIEEINLIRDIFKETGALNYAEMKAFEFGKIAKSHLKKAKPKFRKEALDWFNTLVDFVINRTY